MNTGENVREEGSEYTICIAIVVPTEAKGLLPFPKRWKMIMEIKRATLLACHSSRHDISKYLYKLNSHVISECDIFRRLMPLLLLKYTQPSHCNLLNGSPQSSNYTKWKALSRLSTRRQLLARIIWQYLWFRQLELECYKYRNRTEN